MNWEIFKIEKSWFYVLEDTDFFKIEIWKNLDVVIFDENEFSREVFIMNWSKLNFFSIMSAHSKKVSIFHEQNSSSNINFLILWSLNGTRLGMKSILDKSFSSSSVNIISMVKNETKINLDSKVVIKNSTKEVSWSIIQKNIFLWDSWKIIAVPGLEISSNEAKANHSLSIEKISDEKLFYLRSRWIDKDNATFIMLESYINKNFELLDMGVFNTKVLEEFRRYITS